MVDDKWSKMAELPAEQWPPYEVPTHIASELKRRGYKEIKPYGFWINEQRTHTLHPPNHPGDRRINLWFINSTDDEFAEWNDFPIEYEFGLCDWNECGTLFN